MLRANHASKVIAFIALLSIQFDQTLLLDILTLAHRKLATSIFGLSVTDKLFV